jgi:phage terminase small subunit
MARGLTPKQEKFAQVYVETGNASEAYRAAYACERMKSATVNRRAFDQLENGKISARVKELQAAGQKRHETTLDTIIEELELAREAAMREDPSKSAAVSASMGKAKLLGLIEDKHRVTGSIAVAQLPPLPPEAATAILDRLLEEI